MKGDVKRKFSSDGWSRTFSLAVGSAEACAFQHSSSALAWAHSRRAFAIRMSKPRAGVGGQPYPLPADTIFPSNFFSKLLPHAEDEISQQSEWPDESVAHDLFLCNNRGRTAFGAGRAPLGPTALVAAPRRCATPLPARLATQPLLPALPIWRKPVCWQRDDHSCRSLRLGLPYQETYVFDSSGASVSQNRTNNSVSGETVGIHINLSLRAFTYPIANQSRQGMRKHRV